MARLTSVFILAAFFLLSLEHAAVNAVSLPAVTGKNDVGTIELQLTDYSRINPFAPNSSTPGPRSFMIQLFYPAENAKKYPLAPYMGPGTAATYEKGYGLPPGTISLIQTNSHARAPIKPCGNIELILFSPGYGASRKLYTTLVEDLASHGYLVVTIDHTYDAAVVEFPDGTLVFSDPTNNFTDPVIYSKLFDTRVKDVLFTLEMLYKDLTKSIPGVRNRLKIEETGMFGHSFGGATTAEAMFIDSRIRGGLDLDGSVSGTVVEKGLGRPFVFMGVPSHNLTSDSTWRSLWEKLRGWKRSLVLAGAEHSTYSDLPVAVELLGLGQALPLEELELGTIDGLRANKIQRAYIDAFFDFVLKDKSDLLFKGPSQEYPEISFQS